MSLNGLMLISNSELFTLVGLWALGAATVAGIFFFRRSRIHHQEDIEQH